MQNLSNPAAHGEAIEKQLWNERRTVKTIKSEFSIDGKPVDIICTYSRGAKRIALCRR